jgi:hypothetical protein
VSGEDIVEVPSGAFRMGSADFYLGHSAFHASISEPLARRFPPLQKCRHLLPALCSRPETTTSHSVRRPLAMLRKAAARHMLDERAEVSLQAKLSGQVAHPPGAPADAGDRRIYPVPPILHEPARGAAPLAGDREIAALVNCRA